jgi:S1-C subfamily serine protease
VFDEGREEQPDMGPLLPPDDRLWRHPSEMGRAQPPPQAGPPTASGSGDDGSGRRFPWALSLVSALAGATAALGVVLIAGGLSGSDLERPAAEPVGSQSPSTIPASVRPGGIAQIADAFGPALARIELPDDATASGVLFRDDGLLLTTAHGLGDLEVVPVVLADGERLDGAVLGTDQWTDLAVVRITHEGDAAIVGSSAEVVVGDAALVMAAPLGASTAPTVTVGVVSALEEAMASGARTLRGLIRADAGIAPEASGGALLDEEGNLVGIVTVPPDHEPAGVGYAVPVDLARQVADDLVEHGRARHVWLGIEGADPEGGQAGTGVVVDEVAPDGPAEEAGLHPTDVIVAVADEPVGSMADLVAELRRHEPGDEVEVEYLRGEPGAEPADEPADVMVTLAERP